MCIPNKPKHLLNVIRAAAVLSIASVGVARADYNWNGNNVGALGNMSYSDNWYFNTVPSFGFGGSLHFSYNGTGSSESSIFDDLGGWESVDNIYFDSTFTAPGNAIPWNTGANGFDFDQRLENDWAGTVTINVPTSGAKNVANHIELNPVGGGLILATNVYNDNNVSFQVWGNTTNTLNVAYGLTGNSGVGFTIAQYSIAKFTAPQAWGSASSLTVSNGELWVDAGGSLSVPTVNMNALAGNNNGVAKFLLSTPAGGTTATNAIVVSSGGTDILGGLNTSGTTNTFSGIVTLNGPALLNAANAGSVLGFSGAISGANPVTATGPGTVALSGVNTYSGATTISAGTLAVTGAGQLGSGVYAGLITNNSTLNYGSSAQQALLGSISGTGGLTLSGSGLVALLASNTFSGGIAMTAPETVVITNDSGLGATGTAINITASGVIAATNNGAPTLNTVTISPTRTVNISTGIAANFRTLDTNNLTVGAYLTGAGGVTKTASSFSLGTVRFSNDTNDFTGDVTLGYGNTEFTSVTNQGLPSSLGKGAVGTGGTITINNTSSSGTLRYVGTANSTTTRPLNWNSTIGGYTLDVTGSGSVSYLGAGNLRTGSGTSTLTLNSSSGSGTLGQVINDLGGVTSVSKSGSGTWILSGANTYSGTTTISGGTLRLLNNNNGLGYSTVSVTGNSTLASQTGGSAITLTNAINIGGGAVTATVDAGYFPVTLNGNITGLGNFSTTSSGTTTLGGNDALGNLTSGGTSTLVINGTLAATNMNVSAGNTMTVNGTVYTTNISIASGTFNMSSTAVITNAGPFYTANGSGANNNTNNQTGGILTLSTNDSNNASIRLGHWSTTGTYYNLLGGTLNVPNTILNDGWDGASTIIVGGGTLNAKGLALGGSGHGGGTNVLVMTNGAVNIGASGMTLNGSGPKAVLLGGGTLGASASWSGSVPITFTGTNGNTVIDPGANSITLSAGLNGVGGFSKNSAGALIISGTNTYTGTTVINAGTIQYNSPAYATLTAAVSGSGTLTNNTGTIDIGGSGTTATLSISSPFSSAGGKLVYDLFTPATADLIAMSGSPALTLTGTTTITPVNGVVTNGTYTLINGAGTITGAAANLALGTTSMRTTPTAVFTVSSPTVTMAISGVDSTNLFWQGGTSSTWDINTTANWTNRPGGLTDKFFNMDAVNFDDTAPATASGTNISVSTTVYPGSITFNNSSKIFGLGGSGSIAGNTVLTKAGTSLVVISNANTYYGGTTISGGILRLWTNNPNGIGTGPLTMTGGILDLNSNNLSIGNLSGTGGSISNSYITPTANTRTLTINQTVSNGFAGLILKSLNTNDTAIVKNGSAYLQLSGASTFGGGVTVNAGTLEVTAKSVNDTAYTVAQGATLKFGYSTVGQGGYTPGLTLNGSGIGNAAGLYLLGGKTMSFNSDLQVQTAPTLIQAYGGGTATIRGFDVNTGPFLYTVAAASGTVLETNVSLNTGSYGFNLKADSGNSNSVGDVTIKGIILGTASNTGSGEFGPSGLHKSGTGSVKLTGVNSYSAGTSINAGSLILATNNTLPTGTTVGVGNGGTSGQLILLGVNQTVAGLVTPGTSTQNSLVGGSNVISTLTINNSSANAFNGAIGGAGANQNNIALVKTGAGSLTLSGKLTYAGNTTISAGTVLAGSLTNADGATLSVVDTAGTLVDTNLALGTSVGGTLAITGFSSATSAPIVTTNLTVKGLTTITLAGSFTSGQFPLIQYLSGTINGGGSFTVQQAGLPRGVTATLVTNVPNSSIDVLLTAYPLVWVGATNGVNVATWDNGTTTNWSLVGSPNYFTNNDNVQIDDTAIGSTTLNLVAPLSPFAMLVTNGVLNYTISATGNSPLTGAMGLTKQGPGTLTLTSSNSFTGGVTINGGAINLQNGYAINTNTVTINSGTELELQGGISVTPATSLTLKSAGTNNTGGLRNVGGNNTYGGPITITTGSTRINSDSGTLTITNGVAGGANLVTFGGSGNTAISTGTVSTSAGISKDGSGTNIWNVNPSISSGSLTVNNGTLQINDGNFGGTFTPTIVVNPSGILWGNGTHSSGGSSALVVNGGTWLMSGEDYKQSLTMVDGLIGPGPNPVSAGGELRVGYAGSAGIWTWYVTNSVAGSILNSKLNTIGSTVTNIWNVSRGAAASDLTINGVINGAGNVAFTGNGITTLTATNIFTGSMLASGGTLQLAATAVLPASSLVVASNATLIGKGVVTGPTTVLYGGTVQPGSGGMDTTTITVSNTLTLAGNAIFNVDRTNAQNSSKIAGISTANYGGTLTVNNVGPALQPGDTFTLFQATSYAGGFTNVVLPTLTSPWVWNTNNLAVNGTISVTKAPTIVTLTSSENPSGFNDSVTFTANLGMTLPTGTVVFQTNGVTFDTETLTNGLTLSAPISVLPRGTNVIAAIYSGDAGYQSSSASLNQVVTNHPPAAQTMTVVRTAGLSLKIAVSDIATNWSDADGDTVVLAGINLVTTNSVNLTTNSGWILYTNSPDVNDQISYAISDGFGGTNIGYINITVQSGLVGTNSISGVVLGNPNMVNAYGVPGYTYVLERATNLMPAVWVDVSTNAAATNGVINAADNFFDLGGMPPASAYYRLKYQP